MDYWQMLKGMLGPQPQPAGYDPQAMNPQYGAPQGIVDRARNDAMLQFGMGLMAAGMPMRPSQRPAMMAAAMQPLGQVNQNINELSQAQYLQQKMQAEQAAAEQETAGRQQLYDAVRSMPPGPQRDAAVWFMQAGDYKKAGEILYPQQETAKPSDVMALWKAYESHPVVQQYAVLDAQLGTLQAAMKNGSPVSDLDFIYGVAKALDPQGVVRGEDGQMIIDSTGPAGFLQSYVSQITGGGRFTPEARRQLYAVVERRARELYRQTEDVRSNVVRLGRGAISSDELRQMRVPLRLPTEPGAPLDVEIIAEEP